MLLSLWLHFTYDAPGYPKDLFGIIVARIPSVMYDPVALSGNVTSPVANPLFNLPLYQISQKMRKKWNKVFGWLKQPDRLRKARHVGRWKNPQRAYLWAAAWGRRHRDGILDALKPKIRK